MRRPPPTPAATSTAVAAVERLTVDDLDDDRVVAVGVVRAVFDLVDATASAAGGVTGRWTPEREAIVDATRRLVAAADRVWEPIGDAVDFAS